LPEGVRQKSVDHLIQALERAGEAADDIEEDKK
jgi:hypothetical protein